MTRRAIKKALRDARKETLRAKRYPAESGPYRPDPSLIIAALIGAFLGALLLWLTGCEDVLTVEECAQLCGPVATVTYDQPNRLCVCGQSAPVDAAPLTVPWELERPPPPDVREP